MLSRHPVFIRVVAAILLFIFAGLASFYRFYPTSHLSRGRRYIDPIPKANLQRAFSHLAAHTDVQPNQVAAVIVNHHLIAPDLIADTLAGIQPRQPQTIILLSPNHFTAGHGSFLTSAEDWQTSGGIVRANLAMIDHLVATTKLRVEEPPFTKEHGVANVVPFIQHLWPKTTIVPIIFRDNTPAAMVDTFARQVSASVDRNTLIVASLDFSHYLPLTVSDFHDQSALAAIATTDVASLDHLDLDSQPALRFLLEVLAIKDTRSFHLWHHGNAATVVGNPDLLETTSYLDGVFTAGLTPTTQPLTVLAEGTLDTSSIPGETLANQLLSISMLLRLQAGQDMTLLHRPTTQPFALDDYVAKRGVTMVPPTTGWHEEQTIVRGQEILTEHLRGSDPEDIRLSVQALTEAQLAKLRIADVAWGQTSQDEQSRVAHHLIDAGADVVIGVGNRQLQPVEVYHHRLIAYDLGSLWNPDSEISKSSLALGVTIDQTLTFDLFPIDRDLAGHHLLVGAARDTLLENIARQAVASPDERLALQRGRIVFTR